MSTGDWDGQHFSSLLCDFLSALLNKAFTTTRRISAEQSVLSATKCNIVLLGLVARLSSREPQFITDLCSLLYLVSSSDGLHGQWMSTKDTTVNWNYTDDPFIWMEEKLGDPSFSLHPFFLLSEPPYRAGGQTENNCLYHPEDHRRRFDSESLHPQRKDNELLQEIRSCLYSSLLKQRCLIF